MNEEWVMEFANITWPDEGTCYVTVIATKGGGEPTTRTVSFFPCTDTSQAKK